MTSSTNSSIWLQTEDPTAAGVRDVPSAAGFDSLLSSTGGWSAVAGQTSVFVLQSGFVQRASTQELQQIINFLNQNHIKLCLMAPVLPLGANGSGMGLEGYGNPAALQQAVNRIQSLGGTISYFQMDEPVSHAYDNTSPHSEDASIATIAQQAASSVAIVQSVFPNVQVGLEDSSNISASTFTSFSTDFQQDSGTPLSYVTMDVDWTDATTPAAQSAVLTHLESVAQAIRATGAQFGVVDDGVEGTTSLNWTQSAEYFMAATEADPLIRPNINLVDSWVPEPVQLTPEGQPDTLTHVALELTQIAPLYSSGALTGGKGLTVATNVPVSGFGVAGYGVNLPGISISAQGSGSSTATFAVVVTDVSGLLSAQAKGAGAVTGSGSPTLTLSGSLADINAELATLTYQGSAVGSETVDVTTYDGVGMVDDHQISVASAPPSAVTLPTGISATQLYGNLFSATPSTGALALVSAPMGSSQPLATTSGSWFAQEQVTVDQELVNLTAQQPDQSTVTSWVQALASGETMQQLIASEQGYVTQTVTGLLKLATGTTPSTQLVNMFVTPVMNGTETMEQAEAPMLLGSSVGKAVQTAGYQIIGSTFTSTMAEDYTRQIAQGATMSQVRGEMAANSQVQQRISLEFTFTYEQAPTAAQMSSIDAQIAAGANTSDILTQFSQVAAQQVDADFEQVLGRMPTSSELPGYVNQIEIAGRPNSFIVGELAATTEASNLAASTLQTQFNETPTATAVADVLTVLQNGTSITQVRSDLATIDNFTTRMTGGAPSMQTLAPVLLQYSQGVSMAQMASNLATSGPEQLLLSNMYKGYFGHVPTSTAMTSMTSELLGGSSFTQVSQQVAGLAGSDKPLLSGVNPLQSIAPNDKLFVLPTIAVSDSDPLQIETAKVSLTAGAGTLLSNAGQVSSNGLSVTLTGSAAYVQFYLQKLVFTPSHPATQAQLTVAVQNETGNTTSTVANINVASTADSTPMWFAYTSTGSDTLAATGSMETIVVPASNSAQHTITGFDPTHDILDLPKSLVPSMSAAQQDMKQTSQGALITFGSSNVLLANVATSSLNQNNLHFV